MKSKAIGPEPEQVRALSESHEMAHGPMHHFFSRWIGNLGVVPLLRLRILRFCPLFTSLESLLFWVTRVRETIVQLLKLHLKRIATVPVWALDVKAFMALLLFTLALQAQAQEQAILLSVGEDKEIDLGPEVKSYSVGNPQILSYQAKGQSGRLLVSGKKIGFCQILVWRKDGRRDELALYVLSKQKYLGLLQIAEQLKGPELQVHLLGNSVLVRGRITTRNEWRRLARLQKQQPDLLAVEATPSAELKKSILGEVTKQLLEEFVDSARCWWQGSELLCEHALSPAPSKALQERIEKDYGAKLFARALRDRTRNYRLSIKLVQIEGLKGQDVDLGLSQLQGTLEEIMKQGLSKVVARNNVLLSSRDLILSTLATPQFTVQLGKAAHLEVGAEMPYQATSAQLGPNTQWKFAGLKADFTLEEQGSGLVLNYQSEFTRADDSGAVSGNRESSGARIAPGKAIELFQVELRTWGKGHKGIPFLSSIPLLGNLFKSHNDQATHKKITAVALVEEVP